MSASASAPASKGSLWPMMLLAALTLAYLPLRLLMDTEVSTALYNAFYMYGTALQVLFAAVILFVAFSVGVSQSVGRQWLLLGVGVAMFALGDIAWTAFELFLGIDPYPSIADVFYTAEYVFFLAAIVLAVRAYSGLVKIKRPVLVGAVVAVVGTAVVYLLLLRPYIFADSTGLELIVSTLYPVGDVVLMLAPAVTLALVVAQLGAGRLARPWWVVVAGALVFAFADSFYSYADWAGTGLTAAMDMGWLVANMLFAMAALVARRVFSIQ
ncbi:hypothetical protein EG835_05975 [bacterium]|nr:hypothetical protein [bacterium]